MKIVLNGTPEELKEFLGMNKSNGFNLSFMGGIDIGNGDETVMSMSKDYDSLLNSLPDLPGVNKDTFQYDPERDTGYFGKIDSEEFIGYEELSKLAEFSAGKLMNEDKGWLVFYFKGEIVYMPQHPIRYNVSWEDINQASLVYGDKNVEINDNVYTISLMTGAKSDPLDDVEYWNVDAGREQELDLGNGSMWNELMYRVHQDIPGVTDEGDTGSGGSQHGENWDNLTDEDLNINWNKCSKGALTWTQETSSNVTATRVGRGYNRLARLNRSASSPAYAGHGWRPALRHKIKKLESNA